MYDNKKHRKPKKKIKTMDVILIIIGASLLLFTLEMIRLFKLYGAVPDTLITCVFACLGGECGIMGWIKTTKDKRKDREWMLEDEERHKQEIMNNKDEPQGENGGAENGIGWNE